MDSRLEVSNKLSAVERSLSNKIFGLTDKVNDDFILDTKKGLGKLYKIYKENGIQKWVYIHDSNIPLYEYFDESYRRVKVLSNIKAFAEQVNKLLDSDDNNIKQRTHYAYALGYIYYVKEDFVSCMNLECSECIRLEARVPNIDEITSKISSYIDCNVKYTWILQRIIVRFMVGCDEIDSALQILNMLYNWFGESNDIEDEFFLRMHTGRCVRDPYKDLKNIDTASAHVIKYYHDIQSDDRTTTRLEEIQLAEERLYMEDVGALKDIVNHLQILYLYIELYEGYSNGETKVNDYLKEKREFLDCVLEESPNNKYLEAAEKCGVYYDEFSDLIELYLQVYDSDDTME